VLLRRRPHRAGPRQRAGAGVPDQDGMTPMQTRNAKIAKAAKKSALLVLPLLTVLFWAHRSWSQTDDLDVLKVIPENYKLIIDNQFVRVLEARLPAGPDAQPDRT